MTAPLAINIFWHNTNEDMHHLANICYSFFLRNIDNPLDRYLGIPVYLYPQPPKSISDLNLESMEHSANIFLADDHMNLSNEWTDFVDELITKLGANGTSNHRIFPVASNKNVLNLSEKLSAINFIRLYSVSSSRKCEFLLISLAHEICRMLYNLKSSFDHIKVSEPPIKLFISHAKRDGEQIAINLRNHIHKCSNLDSFFDANDIANGFNFGQEIEFQLKQSVLIILHTDEYSSREWCRREVLLAKKYDCPVIVVNQFDKGELRSFPYIGNIPHINLANISNESSLSFDHIILAALRETLKAKYNFLKTLSLSNAFNVKVETILSYPPELITLLNLKEKQNEVIIYPDPPLGLEEISLLKKQRSDLTFITPSLLPLSSSQNETNCCLVKQKIAIALSEVNQSEDSWIQNRSIQNLMVELTRYLLVGEAGLIYSGKNDYEEKGGYNYATLLLKLVKTYREIYDNDKLCSIINYSFYPIFPLLTIDTKSALKNLINFIEVEPPSYLNIDQQDEALAKSIVAYNSFDDKYVWAKSLSEMRIQMNTNSTAQIVLGGKWVGFKGSISGILEETLLALESKKPTFIIGGFGGVAKGIADALMGMQPAQLQLSFYESHDSGYVHFLKLYNEYEHDNGRKPIDYGAILSFLNSTGKQNDDYGLNNGLTKSENERLFESRNEIEILSLILNGLKNINL